MLQALPYLKALHGGQEGARFTLTASAGWEGMESAVGALGAVAHSTPADVCAAP